MFLAPYYAFTSVFWVIGMALVLVCQGRLRSVHSMDCTVVYNIPTLTNINHGFITNKTKKT